MDALALKGSRRKQSKPIRVSYNDDAEVPLVPHQLPVDDYMNGESMDTGDPDQEKENEMNSSNDMDSRHSSETFPPSEHLSDHSRSILGDSNETGPMNLAREIAFPTAYHRLGSEFLKSNLSTNNEHETSDLDCENMMDKNANDMVDGELIDKEDGAKPKDSRGGIFHPDAFCELCDKEFCNKYFLKTHKANKHGIYDNSLSPFPPSFNPLPPSFILPQHYSSSMPFKLNADYPIPPLMPIVSSKPPTPKLTPTPPIPQGLPLGLPLKEMPSPAKGSPSPPQPSPPTTQALSQSQPQKMSPSIPAVSKLKSDISMSISDEPKKMSQDMEDFCEICQKHFCNKYYLKKHKNDVHGIIPPDTPNSNGKRGGRPPNSEIKLSSSTADSPLIPHSLANLPGLPNMPGVMVLNPFLPPMLIPSGSLMPQHPMQPRPPHLPPLSSSSYPVSSPALPSMSMSDVKNMSPNSINTTATSPSTASSLSAEALRNMGIPVPEGASPNEVLRSLGLLNPDGQIPNEALRGVGVLNAEAFCDICRKEFCNEYFLKIHKANKHGIFMDDPVLPPSMLPAMPKKANDSTDVTSESASAVGEKEHSKDIPRDNKPESSPKAASTPVPDYLSYCNLCSQDFASKYAYRIHRIQAHGMINEPFNEAELAEEAFKLHSGELPKHVSNKIAEEIAIMERSSDAGFSSMFGSMVAAKLADRVTCDICNKELCNKYFLRAHKLKVHGIDTILQERSPKPGIAMQSSFDRSPFKMDFSPSAGTRLDFNSISRCFNLKPDHKDPVSPKPRSVVAPIDPSSIPEKPSNEELVKLGMDPEAYCEICKKEFCSKYFLRTHKQNIHGIAPKTESSETRCFNSAPHLASLSSLSMPLFPNTLTASQPFPSLPSHSLEIKGTNVAPHLASLSMPLPLMGSQPFPSQPSQSKPMNLSSSSGSSNGNGNGNGNGNTNGKPRNGAQLGNNNNWRWKEPVNASRVTCGLCNKELCNKYFLRTHKLNKHGIQPEDQSPMTLSPATSDIETSSNSSLPTDLSFEKNKMSPKLNLENSKLFTNKPEDNSPALFNEVLNLKIKNENDRYNNYFMETCHLCDRKFKSTKWLKQHILKDHAGLTALSPTMEKAFNMGIGGRFAPLELRTCSVCSIVFPSEMSMQLHMIQEHNAQVTIKTDSHSPTLNGDANGQFSGIGKTFGLKRRSTFALKQKMYSCSSCSHKSMWLSKILSHERKVHGISHSFRKFSCHSCRRVFRNGKALQKHMMKRHGNYSMTDLDSGKRYRCTVCDRSFPSPDLCHLHIRQDHIRGRSFRLHNVLADQRHKCSQCSFSTRFAKQLQRHSLRSHGIVRKAGKPEGSSSDEENSGNNNIMPLNLHAEALGSCRSDDYLMQTFRIQQSSNDGVFVTSVVEMPVLKRLQDSASVSFTLTPLDGR